MKHRPFRAAAAIVAAVAALTLTACGSDDKKDEASPSGSATTSQAAGAFEGGKTQEGKEEGSAPATTTAPDLPKPTVAELNDKLTKAFNPAIESKEKTGWIEDAEQDPQLAAKLVDAATKNNVKIEVTEVGDPKDGKLTAKANVTIDGNPVENATIDFVAEGDQWKVAHQFACNIVKSAKLDSAACQN